mgnify:CR=1 FL=1
MAAIRLFRPALLLAAILLLAAGAVEGKKGGKVDVALYYESLCPYSAMFVVGSLAKVFRDGLLDAVDLSLVPYGNARGKDGKISCQVEVPPILSSLSPSPFDSPAHIHKFRLNPGRSVLELSTCQFQFCVR